MYWPGGHGEAPDAVVVQDLERAGAPQAGRGMAAAASAAGLRRAGDAEDLARASGERRGRGVQLPRARQHAVPVLEELAEEVGGLRAREPARVADGDRVRAGGQGERADRVVVQDAERVGTRGRRGGLRRGRGGRDARGRRRRRAGGALCGEWWRSCVKPPCRAPPRPQYPTTSLARGPRTSRRGASASPSQPAMAASASSPAAPRSSSARPARRVCSQTAWPGQRRSGSRADSSNGVAIRSSSASPSRKASARRYRR